MARRAPGEGAGVHGRLEALRVKVLINTRYQRVGTHARQSVRQSPTAKHCEPAERDRMRANTVCARTMDPLRWQHGAEAKKRATH